MGDSEERALYWTSLSRRNSDKYGTGKWKIRTRHPVRVYEALRAELHLGKLADVSGVKIRTIKERELETVYVYVGPYDDCELVRGVASELLELVTNKRLPMERILEYKTDMQTFWQKRSGVNLDVNGKPLKWNGKAWLYRFDGTCMNCNEEMMRLHREIENGSNSADPYFGMLFRGLPKYVFSANG